MPDADATSDFLRARFTASVTRAAWCLFWTVTLVRPAGGQDRVVRRFTDLGDVQVGSVRALAQDSAGFIWVGTVGGLLRWDGLEMRRWDPATLDSWVVDLTVCPDGSLFAVEEAGTLFRITALGAEPVPGPEGGGVAEVMSVRCDETDRLWVANGRGVWGRASGGGWREIGAGGFVGKAPRVISGPASSGAWLRTEDTLWRLVGDGPPRAVAPIPRPVAVVESATGDTLVLAADQGVLRLRGVRVDTVVPWRGRGIDMVRRGSSVWAALDRFVILLRPGEEPEVLGSTAVPEGGGPLLVDREESLWLGTFSGLLQFPEPESEFWNDRHGFPSAHTRFLARTGSRVWATTWQGVGYIDEEGGRRIPHAMPEAWLGAMPMYVGPSGLLWVVTNTGLREIAGGQTVRRRPFRFLHWDIEPARDGGIWLATDHGLRWAPAGSSDVLPVEGTPFRPGEPVRQILHAHDGRLWLGGNDAICRESRPRTQMISTGWSCDTIPGAVEITGLVEMPSGAIWASSSRLGVLWRRGERWEPHPGNAMLSAQAVYQLRPARDGGIWILGFAVPLHVREDLEAPLGWEVVESLRGWQGLASEAHDILEDPDGTLWLTTSLGVARVPAIARNAPTTPPRVALVGVAVDGVALQGAEEVRLRHRHNRLDLRFAALSYRDPSRIRYQARLAPRGDWEEHAGLPTFSWIDLPRGHYRAEVRASLDGRTWTATPASFAITVAAPWYLQPWALALLVGLAVGAVLLAHRLRVAVLLRLERQRTRIALDLHDEMGSGLGSIGILSGVLTTSGLEATERQRLAGKISEIADELGSSLSDIVWSLGPRSTTLEALADRLIEHGARLFAGEAVSFDVRMPERWPSSLLDFTTSRAVLLIGLEALHNAARHANAHRVTLTLAQDRDGWRLVVEDDGGGLGDGEERSPTGLGLESMRRRAQAAGGAIAWEAVPGGGTRVTLRF